MNTRFMHRTAPRSAAPPGRRPESFQHYSEKFRKGGRHKYSWFDGVYQVMSAPCIHHQPCAAEPVTMLPGLCCVPLHSSADLSPPVAAKFSTMLSRRGPALAVIVLSLFALATRA